MRCGWICLFVSLLVAPSCASRAPVDVKLLEQRQIELTQQAAQNQKQLEELNNRLFLLEDKVDTGRVAMQHSGKPLRLPVIKIRPDEGNSDEEIEDKEDKVAEETLGHGSSVAMSVPPRRSRSLTREADESETRRTDDSLVENKRVEYAGAAKQNGPRPVLRLYGERDTGSEERSSYSGPDPSLVQEKLGVVPLPRRSKGKNSANKTESSSESKIEEKLANNWGEPKSSTKKTEKKKETISFAEPSAKKEELSTVSSESKTPRRRVAATDTQPMKEYAAALAKLRAGDNIGAVEAFRLFAQRYPQHSYADNAVYWQAEALYDMKKYAEALSLFRRVVDEYPDGNKTPDALLKMGYCYLKMKENKNARVVLAQLVDSYPSSQVANLASETLAKIQ